ncbi:VWA domain-containing protein [Allorhizocola rhizosphaerae]|uniref:VWA domain-containing protein n=1 Tax=Allorhizocola rhizosphaerae TaxID=1872709 RepID=UPI000E3B97F0|nr:VWA domain-containing protein [Allorhizocola rhizosphaerae]
MSFLNPERLWLLAGVAGLVVVYVVLQLRRSRYAVRFTNLALLERLAPTRPGWRRHVPAGLFLAMLALLVLGFARPVDDVRVPRERATVVVAVDVSASMRATDVSPDRLGAAREAARAFVDGLPEHFNVGLIAFAGGASVAVAPTTDRDAVRAGIEGLGQNPGGAQGTAIGEAVDAALRAVRTLDERAGEDPPPARVVVLSDGANTSGREPAESAADAAAAGVPVDTIAFGTGVGTIVQSGRAVPVPLDGQTLRMVAEQTAGTYHEAGSGAELREIYEGIGSSIGYRIEQQDVAARFIGFALLAALAAAAASLLWFARLP